MIHLDKDYYLDADQYQFFIKEKAVSKAGNVRFDMVGSYPSISTLVRGLSDRQMYDAVRRCASLKSVQDDLVAWADGFKSPLVEGLKDAVRRCEP